MEVTDIHLESEPLSTIDRPKETSSIPFNVIMLKQDKQKLMQKKNAIISQEEDSITTLMSQKCRVKK